MSSNPFLQYLELNGKNIYFVQILGFGGKIVYYCEMKERLKNRYIVFNRFKDEVSYSDELLSGGQSVCIKILELEKTSAFSEYPPKY